MAAVLGRKAISLKGLDTVGRINRATHAQQVEKLTRDYLTAKVTSLQSEAENRACLRQERACLITHVAVSCAPFVGRAADACMDNIPLLRTQPAESLRKNRQNHSTSYGGTRGGSGGDSGGECGGGGGGG